MSTASLKSSNDKKQAKLKKKREQRNSHHDWMEKQNKSIISQEDIYNDIHNTCSDKFCRLFSKLPMLSPFGPIRCGWDILVMFMLIYTSLEVPFTLGFGIELTLHGKYYRFGIIALIIDICLCCDLVLNFRTAFFDKYDDLRLITNSKRIAFRYVKGWFVLDLVTSFPFEFILPDNAAEEQGSNFSSYVKILRIFRLFRIFKILRLLKMVKLFDGFVSNIIAREILMVVRLFKVLCFALLSAHMCACLWYYTGCESFDRYEISWIDDKGLSSSNCGIDNGNGGADSSLFVRYSFSWYWSVVTLFTTGYGDLIATNPLEQWIATLVILIGTCLFGYFVGTITSLITEGDKVSSMIVNKLEDAQHFCQQKKLPRDMARAVLTHTRYHCNHNYILGDENDVLSNLPSYLAMDVSLYISRKYLENLDFLSNKYIDPYIRGLIALKMKSISCNKGYKLFVKGDVAEKIYIQRIGKSDHYIYDINGQRSRMGKPMKKPYKEKIKRGDVVGEYAFIQKKRDSTLIMATWCEFYVLDVADIKEILEQHYGLSYLKIYRNIQSFIKKEHEKPIRKRKKRTCLLRQNPLLPSFNKNKSHDQQEAQGLLEQEQGLFEQQQEEEEEEGQQGHCDWGNAEEIKEINNLRDLEKMTNEVLNANKNDLNNNNINFGLNALSRNAYKITKLTNDKNKQFIKTKIRNPLHVTSNITLHATKSMLLKSLTRQNSFLRDMEVTKDYNGGASSDESSSNSDMKYEKKQVEEEGNEIMLHKLDKRDTLEVAGSIAVEMMHLQHNLHENDANNNNNNNNNNNIYSDIDHSNVNESEKSESVFDTDNDNSDSNASNGSNESNDNNEQGRKNVNNKTRKKGDVKRKKRRKNHKTHH